MRCSFIITMLLLLSMSFHFQCSKENNPVEVKDDNTTAFVTMPQQDIPWPGLANSPCPMFLYNPQHTARSAFAGPKSGTPYKSVDIGPASEFQCVVGTDGSIYITTLTKFFAINPDGSIKWSYATDTKGHFEYTPMISNDGTIYVSKEYQGLCAFNPDGTMKWNYQLENQKVSLFKSPAISKDGKIIYVVSCGFRETDDKNYLVAINKNGNFQWKCEVGSSFPMEPAISPDGSMLYVKTNSTGLFAVDSSGVLKWTFPTIGDNNCCAMVDNAGNIYTVSDGYCYSLSPTGHIRWKTHLNLTGQAFSNLSMGWEGYIYAIGDEGQSLYALDYAGNVMWNVKDYILLGATPIVDKNELIYLTPLFSLQHKVNFVVLNPDGKLAWNFAFTTPGTTEIREIDGEPIIISNNRMAMASSMNYLIITD